MTVSQQELLAFLAYPNETLSNEYKSWLDLSSNKGKATLAKAAIALANHGGGTIVIGMRGEGEEKLRSLPRPKGMPRYSTDTVNAAINRYADPSMHYDVSFEVHPETGIEHAFIHVPPSTVPVMCTRLEEKIIQQNRVYIRKAGPKSEEPNTAEEWRVLFSRCIQAGRESMLDSIRIILQGHAASSAPPANDLLSGFTAESFERWKSLIANLPTDAIARLPKGHYQLSFEIIGASKSSLKEMMDRLREANKIQLTGWGPFIDFGRAPIGPHPVEDTIESWQGYESEGRYGVQNADFWRADPRGMLYEIRGYEEDFTDKAKPGQVFDGIMPIWRVGEAILYVGRLARTYGDSSEIRIRGEYNGLKGRQIASIFDRSYAVRRGLSMTDRKILEIQATTTQIEDNLAEVLHSFLQPLYEQFEFSTISLDLISVQLRRLMKR